MIDRPVLSDFEFLMYPILHRDDQGRSINKNEDHFCVKKVVNDDVNFLLFDGNFQKGFVLLDVIAGGAA